MKLRFLFMLTIAMLSMKSVAQEEQDPWVGTWTSVSYRDMDFENSPKDSEGTYQEIIQTDYKLVIRITKKNNEYNVRAKTIKVNDPNYSSYHRPLTIKRMAGNTIWLESYVKKMPFTVNYGNGPFVESYSDVTYFYKLTLNDGTMHYSHYKMHSVEYDRNMNYKEEETTNVSDMRGHDLDLFNDDW